MTAARVVKWRGPNRGQWHFGIVVDTPSNDRTVVEYSHSTPASNVPPGRVLTLDASKLREV